jgi:hypothetical protein
MALPPVAELRHRLIAFGGWHPERVRHPEPVCRPRAVDFASHLARGFRNAVCQVDPRAFAMLGVPMFFPDTSPWEPENRA